MIAKRGLLKIKVVSIFDLVTVWIYNNYNWWILFLDYLQIWYSKGSKTLSFAIPDLESRIKVQCS